MNITKVKNSRGFVLVAFGGDYFGDFGGGFKVEDCTNPAVVCNLLFVQVFVIF